MGERSRRMGAAAFGLLAALTVSARAADDYSNPAYLAYDADNVARTTQRQQHHFTSRAYQDDAFDTTMRTWLEGVARQFGDLQHLRFYTGLGQIIPGGNVGDPEHHFEGERVEVEFLNRNGAKIVGNVWPCPEAGACPGIVVTTGSIQVTQHMYGWAARHLQANGYTVFTFDVQGQGESEGTSHPNDPSQPGSNPRQLFELYNPQQEPNFVDTTIDAIRFFLSTPSAPYQPIGWSAAEIGAVKADAGGSSKLDWHNPRPEKVDPSHLGLAGHSLGATAVSRVQQCSSLNLGTLPAICNDESFPIRAIVAWDSLSTGGAADPITPVVPALDHRSDGYFINAVPTPSAPDPQEKLSSFTYWKNAGRDVYAITVRGGTHAEWSEIPYIVSASRYGQDQAKYYLLAWFDRYVHPSPARASAGSQALLDAPIPAATETLCHAYYRASLFSVKYRSAFAFHRTADSTFPAGTCDGSNLCVAADLRAYGGVVPLRDWAGANAEKQGVGACAPESSGVGPLP